MGLLQTIYSVVSILGVGAEIALLLILTVHRQHKSFPVFSLYIAYNLLSDLALLASAAVYSAQVGKSLYFASLPMQYLLELAVLFEIAWKVLRPVQPSLPKGAVRAFLVLVSLAMVGGIVLAWWVPVTGNTIDDIVRPLNLTVGLLRMTIFAATAGFAQVLGIGWKNRVLQIATALSFYSAVDLMITLAERHSGNASALEPMRAICYLLEISFLVWAFTTKEVRRGEFSPQMEQFLVTLAMRAKHARSSLIRMQVK